MWEKRLGPRRAAGPWADDFPLDHGLPARLVIDCSQVQLPIHTMFATRLRLFRDWHVATGRVVSFVAPEEVKARHTFEYLQIDGQTDSLDADALILPVTQLREFKDVDEVADRTRAILEYDRPEISALGAATYMAVAELCGNAVEHGASTAGAYVAVQRVSEPRLTVSIAVADLGIGIPEHLRQHYPEWHDDAAAIGRAMEPRVSGTGSPHRGNGFSEVFEAALTSTLHSAKIEIHAGAGFLRTNLVQERRTLEPFPAASPRRGTCISYELLSV